MKAHKVKAVVNNTPIDSAYLFTDDDIAAGTFVSQQSTGWDWDNSEDIPTWFDSAIETTSWRRAPQACYNGGTTQMGLQKLVTLIEQHWAGVVDFKRLPTIYHQSAVLATSAKINDNTILIDSEVEITSTNEVTSILTDSPFEYTIGAYGSANTISFRFYVLPESAIQNGKLNLSTELDLSMLTLRIYFGGNTWQLDAYVSLHATVPERWISKYHNLETDDDPYSDEGDSDTGGGGDSGDQDAWDDDGDTTPVPPLPTISAVDTGFITLYNPTMAQLQNLASYMWSGLFDLDSFRKIMANPMDTIIGLSIVPVDVPSGSAQTVMVGNIDTGISLTKAATQYIEVNCSTIDIKELRHSYLDYSPYTKISLMLPYIGSVDLTIDQLYSSDGGSLGVVYHVDILSGACVAFVTINGDVIGQYSGQCAVSIPVTGEDFTNTIRALGGLVAAGVSAIASGGLSAPVSAANIAGGVTAMANTAINVASSKPTFSRAGNIAGANGLLSVQKPFVILERPRLCSPGRQNAFAGYPAYITYTLGSLSGFTQLENIKLDGIPMTDTERDELMALLRSGVIL